MSRQRALFHFRKFSFNAVLQIGSQVLPLLAGAVAIPLIYKNIGRAEFGVFTVALSMLGLFALLDLGLGRATVRFMARALADGRPVDAASVFAHSAIMLGTVSLTSCIGLILTIPYIVSHWFQLAMVSKATVEHCLFILAAALPFAGLTSVFRAVLEAHEEFLIISLVQVVLGVLTYVVPLLISFATGDVRIIIAGAVACRGFAFLAFFSGAAFVWRGPFPWSVLNIRAQKEFQSFSLWVVISNIVGSAIVYGDRALLVKMFGLSDIPFYNVPLELLGRLMIIVNSAATVVFPALSRVSGDKAFDSAYVGLNAILSVIVGCVLLGMSMLTPLGLHLWLGDEFRDHSTSLVQILLVGLAFQSLNVFALASLNAKGIARPITVMHLVETPIYFWALFECGRHFGLAGVAVVWSGRLLVEYVCFVGFQIVLDAKDRVSERVTGAIIGACNLVPLSGFAFLGNRRLALAVAGISAVGSIYWAASLLRREYFRGEM